MGDHAIINAFPRRTQLRHWPRHSASGRRCRCAIVSHTPAKTRVSGFRQLPVPGTRLGRSQSTFQQRLTTPAPPKTASGVPYYGYRFYSPELGRWLNRDPIGEVGGLNVYVFCRNEPVTHVDLLGMIFCPVEYNENLDDESFRQARGNYAGDSFPYGFFAGAEVQFDRVSDRKKSRCGFFQTGHRYRIRPPLMCRGRIYTRKGSPSITKQHEEGHFKNYKDWFKKHEALWQSWENACVCKPCYDAVDAWIDKQSNVLRIERLINDKKLDITDYTKIDHSKSKIEDLQWELQILESALHTERGRSAELKRKKEIACK